MDPQTVPPIANPQISSQQQTPIIETQQPTNTTNVQPNNAQSSTIQHAGFWIRLVAILLDVFVVLFIFLIISFPLSRLGFYGEKNKTGPLSFEFNQKETTINGEQSPSSNLANVILITIVLTYGIGTTILMGQSLGKKTLGIKIVDKNGNKPKLLTAIIRSVVKIFISTIILFFGFLLAAFDGNKQALHDKAASTHVIIYSQRGKAITLALLAVFLIAFGILLFKFALLFAFLGAFLGGLVKSN